jgi:hypothetical protein
LAQQYGFHFETNYNQQLRAPRVPQIRYSRFRSNNSECLQQIDVSVQNRALTE